MSADIEAGELYGASRSNSKVEDLRTRSTENGSLDTGGQEGSDQTNDNSATNGPKNISLESSTSGNSDFLSYFRPRSFSREKPLCAICSKLNLSVERFIIDDDSLIPTSQARNPYLPELRPLSSFSIRSNSNEEVLGTYEAILNRSEREDCPFCTLVINSSIGPQDRPKYGVKRLADTALSATCYLAWEIDGRENAHGRVKGRTRRIHLTWKPHTIDDSYLVFKAPERYFPPDSDAHRNPGLFFGLGREIDVQTSRQALIRAWVNLCTDSHHGLCESSKNTDPDFCSVLEQSYFGVIDVQDWRLTSLPHKFHRQGLPCMGHEQYVALSYVWGKPRPGHEPYLTTISNIIHHRGHGGLEIFSSCFPRAVQDAIRLVQQLGMRYIWIDALCIVQDSSRSWKLNSRVMSLIYGNATLTICAADGDDSSAGLRAMHPLEKQGVHHHEEICAGIHLMVSRPPETSIRASVWNTRAWTFQERLLSKRCLIFVDSRVYFQCPSTSMSEDIFADRDGSGWSLDLIHAPLLMLSELKRRTLWVYTNCVPLYTRRALSKPHDILAAFDGICDLMEKTMQAPFVFSLPTSHFDFALLWEPKSVTSRRNPRKDEISDWKGLQFPSWSWCGWSDQAEYQTAMVGGCLTNLRDWLTKHTWIHWYVRDGRGDLRPLWQRGISKEDQSSEERWKGYRLPSNEAGDTSGGLRQDGSFERKEDYDNARLGAQGVEHSARPQSSKIVKQRNDKETGLVPNQSDLDEAYGRYRNKSPKDYNDGDWEDPRRSRCKDPTKFYKTLPENPYRVVMAEFATKPSVEFPDQPILQFWTLHALLHIVSREIGPESSVETPYLGLVRHDIIDGIGDWCGSLLLNKDWMKTKTSTARYDSIAISEAKEFTQAECPVWTYYIPKEREQSEWDLYYVLLLEKHGEVWERVALGKVFKLAFSEAIWDEIVLG